MTGAGACLRNLELHPVCLAGPQVLGPSFSAYPGTLAGNWVGARAVRIPTQDTSFAEWLSKSLRNSAGPLCSFLSVQLSANISLEAAGDGPKLLGPCPPRERPSLLQVLRE